MKLTLNFQKIVDPVTNAADNRHGTFYNGILFMTTRTLVRPNGEAIEEDFEDNFLITGSRVLQRETGEKMQVFSVEIVNKAIHTLVDHTPWRQTENNTFEAEFTVPGRQPVLINSGQKSRILRATKKPSSAWLGFNRARGYYLAGAESCDDLYLKRPIAEGGAP